MKLGRRNLSLLRKKYEKEKEGNFVIDIGRQSLATFTGTATESLIHTLSDFHRKTN